MVLVSVDVLIVIIFAFAMIRLRAYEKLASEDIRQGKVKIEDFSLFVKKVPIDAGEYANQPELLKAMVVVHLQRVLAKAGNDSDEDDSDRPETQAGTEVGGRGGVRSAASRSQVSVAQSSSIGHLIKGANLPTEG